MRFIWNKEATLVALICIIVTFVICGNAGEFEGLFLLPGFLVLIGLINTHEVLKHA